MSKYSKFFRNDAMEYAFCLLELDGETRMEKLKIYQIHYKYRHVANEWYNEILNALQTGEIDSELQQEAIKELNAIYNNMTKNSEEDQELDADMF